MRTPKVSPALLVAILALIVASTGTAAAALPRFMLQSGSGKAIALVDGAGQLTTSLAQPAQFLNTYNREFSGCTFLYTVPARRALVITDIVFDVLLQPAGGPTGSLELTGYSNNACTGSTGLMAVSSQAASTSTVHISAGYVVQSGHGIGVDATNALGSTEISGYLIPAGAAPPH